MHTLVGYGGGVDGGHGGADPCEGKGFITPTDITNSQCKIKFEDDNRGGCGRTTVEHEAHSVVPNAHVDLVPVELHSVLTPGSNVNAQAHYHPDEN